MWDRPPRVDELASRGRSNGRMYTVYVLKSSVAEKTYVGFTNDLERRLAQHNSGKSAYTRRYKPWEILKIELFETYIDARRRENFYKTGAGRKELKKLFENNS